jgi:hypothetical protein
MMIEQKIDAFRYRLVRWLVAILRTLGAETRANELWMFNSRFECPVCRLIRAMRVQNRVLLDSFLRHLPGMAAPVLPRCMALCGRAVPGGNFSVSTGFSVRASDVAASENPDLPTKKGVAELA